MFRFTIRDVLWLTVVVALAVVMLRERALLNSKLASLQAKEAAVQAEQVAVKAKRRELEAQLIMAIDATERLNNQLQSPAKGGP
jgi:hypothetical protein